MDSYDDFEYVPGFEFSSVPECYADYCMKLASDKNELQTGAQLAAAIQKMIDDKAK